MHPTLAAPPHGLGGPLLLCRIFLQQLERMDWPTLSGDRLDGGGLPCQVNPVIFPRSQFTPHCIPINCAGRTRSHGCVLLSHPRPCHHTEPISPLCPRGFLLLPLCNATPPSHLPICSLKHRQQPHLHFHDHLQMSTAGRMMCHRPPPPIVPRPH